MIQSNKNTKAFYETQTKIWKALSDGQWHRTNNLKKTTKLSPRTLHKHLKQLTKDGLIDRKRDIESEKYPIPVLYKAQSDIIEATKTMEIMKKFSNKIDAILKETKNNPLIILDLINKWNQTNFIRLLKTIQNHKDIPLKEIETLTKLHLWLNYEWFTQILIEATTKIIKEVDINQCIIDQAKLNAKTAINWEKLNEEITINWDRSMKELIKEFTEELLKNKETKKEN